MLPVEEPGQEDHDLLSQPGPRRLVVVFEDGPLSATGDAVLEVKTEASYRDVLPLGIARSAPWMVLAPHTRTPSSGNRRISFTAADVQPRAFFVAQVDPKRDLSAQNGLFTCGAFQTPRSRSMRA